MRAVAGRALALAGALAGVALAAFGADAAPQTVATLAPAAPVRAHVALTPERHHLRVRAALDLDDAILDDGAADAPIVVALDARLIPERWSLDGRALEARPKAVDDGTTRWTLDLTRGEARQAAAPLTVVYGGRLRDPAAGAGPTDPTAIHDLRVRGHVGPVGVYLSADVVWLPRHVADADALLPTTRTRATLVLDAPAGVALVASGDPIPPPRLAADDGGSAAPNRVAFHTPYPVVSPVVAGGRLERHRRVVADVDVELELLLDASNAHRAAPLLDAFADYLHLYVPRLGPFPFARFTLVENFFRAGFAFPGFTLIGSEVLALGDGALRPGYLDHELLHAWWGHALLGDASQGNWWEALATWGASHQRPVLEEDPGDARRFRRDAVLQLSRIPPSRLAPLVDFGRVADVSRTIGYRKGGLVVDWLAAEIGDDAAWRGLRDLHATRFGTVVTWDDLERAWSAAADRDLAPFFDRWVRTAALPALTLDGAAREGDALVVTLARDDVGPDAARLGASGLAVPIALYDADGIEIGEARARDVQPGISRRPLVAVDGAPLAADLRARVAAVALDPAMRLPRRLPPPQRLPNLAELRPPEALYLLRDPDDAARFASLTDAVGARFAEADRLVRRGRRIGDLDLDARHVFAVGRAVRAKPFAAYLDARVRDAFPDAGQTPRLAIDDAGFAVEGTRFDQPGDALFACLPRRARDGAGGPSGVLCLLHGNAPEALGRVVDLLPFYGDSLLVFRSGSAVLRRTFEPSTAVAVR